MSTVAVLALTVLIHLQAAGGSACPSARAETKSAPALTILFFTASWCEPCRAVSPILEKFTRKHEKQVKLVTLDFDLAKTEVNDWDVQEIPAVIVLSPRGQILLRYAGADRQSLGTLGSELESLLRNGKKKGSEYP
jgi:thioredoxin-like negative regulator of GroEL